MPLPGRAPSCRHCRDDAPLPFDFTMAFQPILDVARGRVWAHEALVRGPSGEGAAHVLSQVDEGSLYRFDQAARVRAIEMAGRLLPDDGSLLSINFMPNAVYEPASCIRASLMAAARVGFPPERLMFEFTEHERLDPAHARRIVEEYRRQGFTTAIDDFGTGFSNLGLLAEFQPDVLKLDMGLIRGIDASGPRRAIVAGVMATARALGIAVVAEGIETREEAATLSGLGVTLMQGYFFARPLTGALPAVANLAPGPSERLRA